MKHRDREGLDESSSDERIIEPSVLVSHNVDQFLEEEVDFFENSQELTQIVPRKSDSSRNGREEEAQKKTKKRKKETMRDSSPISPSPERGFGSYNGVRVREMDVSEIPGHVIVDMKRISPTESDCSDGLTVEDVQKAASSSKGGIWILKCPRDVNLSDLLPGKKLSLDGESSIIDFEEEDDSPHLTQFLPTSSLGVNAKDRQFEATSVVNDEYKDGAVLILPDDNKFKLVAAPIQGHIIIRECVKELRFPEIKTPKPKARKLPGGIKERHPVYGADFSKIVDKMESAPTKKRKKSNYPDTFNESTNDFAHGLGFTPTIVPKIEIEIDDNTHSQKKKEKKERKDDDTCVKNNYTHQNGSAVVNSFDEDNSSLKKKSKKRKREELEESYQDLDQTNLVEVVSEPASKKFKKSKHKSIE